MQYRSFGSLDWKVSVLGFGTMRLPIVGGNQAAINELEAVKLIRYAIDKGVNYIDSAYVYHEGNSEVVVGKALEGKYRNKVRVATKMPVFLVQEKEDLDRIFNVQLKRLKTDHIDFYLLHSLMRSSWNKVNELNILDWAERQIKKDKIKYLGFSFHDEFEVFKEIIDGYDKWSFCQIQFNYLDEEYQAGKAGLKYAFSRGLAVVVMEPLAGGLLAAKPPTKILGEWNKAGMKCPPPYWGLQWVWNHPEVAVALSGMNSMEQVHQNIESANHSGPNTLSQKELKMLSLSRELFFKQGYIGCTKCHYCEHCPQNIDIPVILAFLNEYACSKHNSVYREKIKQEYKSRVPDNRRASNCRYCGQCEAICPQHLPIRRLLNEATKSIE